MTVVDASIVVRLLQNRSGDDALRSRFGRERTVCAPALIDAEVASAVRGLLLSSTPRVRISSKRAEQMLVDYTDLPVVRFPMQPFQRQVLALRDNFTAYDAFYLCLAESLGMTLLTDDRKFARAPDRGVLIETWS